MKVAIGEDRKMQVQRCVCVCVCVWTNRPVLFFGVLLSFAAEHVKLSSKLFGSTDICNGSSYTAMCGRTQ